MFILQVTVSRASFFLRLKEALSDCVWAQKHMRENAVIDYKQLGLRYKLYSWQVGAPMTFHLYIYICISSLLAQNIVSSIWKTENMTLISMCMNVQTTVTKKL